MKPEEALTELTVQASDGHKAGIPPPPFSDGINRSYFLLRRWIAIIALILPVALWVGDGPWPHSSISEYYHSPGGWSRDVLVGSLSAVGFFLFFYRGYSKSEDIVLNLAGLSAVLVAFAPMPWPGTGADPRLIPLGPIPLHGLSAALLFLFIAYVCIFRSEQTLKLLHDPKQRASFRLHYRILGTLMVAVPASIFAIHLLSRRTERSLVVFSLETAGIIVFALYWLEKSREIAVIQRQ
ncbi:MAG TPA: hypothetical protein VHG29_06510 [Novosphingobium sp.]|nr:hypothetical protein [Novosphingobium sp.]